MFQGRKAILAMALFLCATTYAGFSIRVGKPYRNDSSNVVLQPGQSVNVDGTQVYCTGSTGFPAVIQPQNDRCDSFHSDSSCQNAFIGTACLSRRFGEETQGTCIRESNFAGKPNCKCK